jgi:hypothetical protein
MEGGFGSWLEAAVDGGRGVEATAPFGIGSKLAQRI